SLQLLDESRDEIARESALTKGVVELAPRHPSCALTEDSVEGGVDRSPNRGVEPGRIGAFTALASEGEKLLVTALSRSQLTLFTEPPSPPPTEKRASESEGRDGERNKKKKLLGEGAPRHAQIGTKPERAEP